MANSKKPYSKKKIQDTDGSGFGHYQEEVGGGDSPNPKQPGTHGHGVNSDYRRNNNKTMQPRDKFGHFTYKSVNGQSIDPKYGPSRGKTVNPLLTGGDGTIKIDDVERDFSQQSGNYWNKYKDKWYQKGSEIVTTDRKVRVAGDAIWNVAKERYDTVKGEFEGESHVFDETKKGAPGQAEKAAKQKFDATGEEQGVIDQNTGGLKLKPGALGTQWSPKPQPIPKPAPQPRATPINPTTPGQQPTAGVQASASVSNYVPKYTNEDFEDAKEIMKNDLGFSDEDIQDFDNLSPQQKDDYIDSIFERDDGDDNNVNNNPAPAPAQESEEDSDAIKKVKQMGFNGD